MTLQDRMREGLHTLQQKGNLRKLSPIAHCGKEIEIQGKRLLNLSSNDYLGLASCTELQEEFIQELKVDKPLFSASSSRLLTGNFEVMEELEQTLANLFQREAALVFNSGYHANTGILPAVCNADTLILADKLVHASLIDGIRLSSACCIRYRHNDLKQLARLLETYHSKYSQIIVVTESIFSMDGDCSDLTSLVELKKQYSNVVLYVDEAHAFGLRGEKGLGCAEETNTIADIDFLVGTFGKAAASAGAYLICSKLLREYLINHMRTLIFTTAMPPINMAWTLFIVRRLDRYCSQRAHLARISKLLKEALEVKGYTCPSDSHIVPMVVGNSADTLLEAETLQQHGFYALPVRPPTIPEGTSRIRFSLTAAIKEEEIASLIKWIDQKL
ncbi:MAG: 8-amino-7-oxononanoate synthase [Phocaeicola sp.]